MENKKVKEILIKNEVVKEVKNEFYIVMKFIFGDEDIFTMKEIGPFFENQMDRLFDAIETCDRMIEAFPEGKDTSDGYDEIEGFSYWFKKFGESDELAINIPYDDMDYQACLDKYKVCYYKDGDEFDCDVNWHE